MTKNNPKLLIHFLLRKVFVQTLANDNPKHDYWNVSVAMTNKAV
jgi:hypothetical protein